MLTSTWKKVGWASPRLFLYSEGGWSVGCVILPKGPGDAWRWAISSYGNSAHSGGIPAGGSKKPFYAMGGEKATLREALIALREAVEKDNSEYKYTFPEDSEAVELVNGALT